MYVHPFLVQIYKKYDICYDIFQNSWPLILRHSCVLLFFLEKYMSIDYYWNWFEETEYDLLSQVVIIKQQGEAF